MNATKQNSGQSSRNQHNTDPVLKLFPTQLIGVMNKTEISGTVLT